MLSVNRFSAITLYTFSFPDIAELNRCSVKWVLLCKRGTNGDGNKFWGTGRMGLIPPSFRCLFTSTENGMAFTMQQHYLCSIDENV